MQEILHQILSLVQANLNPSFITGILIFTFGYSLQDKQEFHYNKSLVTYLVTKWISKIKKQSKREFWTRFFAPSVLSWINKYKLDEDGDPIKIEKKNLYHKLAGIDNKERFIFSSNLLVSFTDVYHLCTLIQVVGISILLGIYWLYIPFMTIHHVLFHYILSKKN